MSLTIPSRIDEKQIYQTPRGIALWPKLLLPDTRFNRAGVYEVRMRFAKQDEALFLAEMTQIYDLAYEQILREQAKTDIPQEAPPWKETKDGHYEFKFKLNAGGISDLGPISRHAFSIRAETKSKIPIRINCGSAMAAKSALLFKCGSGASRKRASR